MLCRGPHFISKLLKQSPSKYILQNSIGFKNSLHYLNIVVFLLQCMCFCLELQFDSVIQDRTMILQKLHLLANVLPDKNIFSWEFFLNRSASLFASSYLMTSQRSFFRFDTLCLEAQLDLESSESDVACLQGARTPDVRRCSFYTFSIFYCVCIVKTWSQATSKAILS